MDFQHLMFKSGGDFTAAQTRRVFESARAHGLPVKLHGSDVGLYYKLFAGDVGIDPYTRAVSDVYQDVFQEGSFIGKGIYEVDAFERALKGRFPENRILSHDLLEGCYARSGLASDVQFYYVSARADEVVKAMVAVTGSPRTGT